MRNGDNRHIGKLVVNRRQIGQVEPAVQGGQVRKRSATREREVKIVDMEMDDVELVEALKRPPPAGRYDEQVSLLPCSIAASAERLESGVRLSWNRRWRKV